MKWRRTKHKDIPEIRALWERAGYGFAFPDLESKQIISSWVAVEAGRIVCWSGARLEPEIVSIIDPEFGSPHRRLHIFARFHLHMAKDLRKRGFERVFATLDPKFPRFGVRLGRFGWQRGWDYWFLLIERVLGKNENNS